MLTARPIEEISVWFSKITSLSLRSNSLQDKHAQVLAEVVAKNQSLTELTLWDNEIGDVGCIALGDALRFNKKLLCLSLGRNRIADKGFEYLMDSLTVFKLTTQQVLERKRSIIDLEKRKKEAENRRKRVIKGKTIKQASAAASNFGNLNPNTNPTLTPRNNVNGESPAMAPSSPKKATAPKTEEMIINYDILIEDLQPIEDGEGVAYGRGNRTLAYINLSYNKILNPAIIFTIKEVNKVIQHISIEGNGSVFKVTKQTDSLVSSQNIIPI